MLPPAEPQAIEAGLAREAARWGSVIHARGIVLE
jgi:hypothetical protein